jgi:hypothetical protein
MNYEKTKEIISATDLLGGEDLAFIEQSIAGIQSNWKKRQIYRTETEMRVSVLNDVKFPTAAAKYWQAVREQSVMYEQIIQESWTYRLSKIELLELEEKLKKARTKGQDLKVQKLEIQREQVLFKLLNIESSARDRMRELRLWDAIMRECREADPAFDYNDVNTHQLVSYTERWHAQLQQLDASQSSISERNNLVGQYVSGLRECISRGIKLPPALEQDAIKMNLLEDTQKNTPVLRAVFDLQGIEN